MSNIVLSPLKQARIKSGLKVDEIAQSLGVSQQTYYNYESGNREPSGETLKTLATMFSVTTDFLLEINISCIFSGSSNGFYLFLKTGKVNALIWGVFF